MEEIKFERKRFTYVNSRGSQQKDILVIKNSLLRVVQVEVRVEGYLLDLLILESSGIKFYDLHFLAIPSKANISVTEVLRDLDMTHEKNRNYQNFEFFKDFRQWDLSILVLVWVEWIIDKF